MHVSAPNLSLLPVDQSCYCQVVPHAQTKYISWGHTVTRPPQRARQADLPPFSLGQSSHSLFPWNEVRLVLLSTARFVPRGGVSGACGERCLPSLRRCADESVSRSATRITLLKRWRYDGKPPGDGLMGLSGAKTSARPPGSTTFLQSRVAAAVSACLSSAREQ